MQYLISFKTEGDMVIEAGSEEEAREAFFDLDNFQYAADTIDGNEIEIVEIEEYHG